MLVRELQPENAEFLIVINPEGSVMDSRAVQLENADIPIVVMLSGRVTLLRVLHWLNERSGISVPLVIVTVSRHPRGS